MAARTEGRDGGRMEVPGDRGVPEAATSGREEGKSLGEWKGRVGSKVAAGAALGAAGGALAATLNQLSLVGTAFNMSANFAIFAGLCGTTQELIRASSSAEEITLGNSVASGFLTGGFLCGVNRWLYHAARVDTLPSGDSRRPISAP
uniref:Uncharacterized protein n=1 Tax=Chloropicon roscoffensis TaxID=1461544 RepID=A0A7S3C917_9CHLO|mmetsp:Transcript_2124/g.6605  ORF Transcript_2124/g.6605 Transcript_2124/m.6605 type:complete len:147 (+) Transcript_2124:2-442(+)